MTFGSQTVGFVTVTLGDEDPNGVREPTTSTVFVEGCRFRPLSVAEKNGVFNVATEVWKCTAPPDAAVLAATSIDELIHDGTETPVRGDDDENVYQIVGGVQPFTDFSNDVHKVTVLCQKQKG